MGLTIRRIVRHHPTTDCDDAASWGDSIIFTARFPFTDPNDCPDRGLGKTWE